MPEKHINKRRVVLSYTNPSSNARESELVFSFPDLRNRLLELEGEQFEQNSSMGVNLDDDSGEGFAIGLAQDGWILCHDNAEHTLLRFSIGDESEIGTNTFYFDQWESLPRRYLISKELACDVLREWLEDDSVSNALRWDENSY